MSRDLTWWPDLMWPRQKKITTDVKLINEKLWQISIRCSSLFPSYCRKTTCGGSKWPPRARLISIVHGHAFCRFARLILLGRMLLAISVCLRNYYIVKDMPQRSWFAENKWQESESHVGSLRLTASLLSMSDAAFRCSSIPIAIPRRSLASSAQPQPVDPDTPAQPHWFFIPTINGCRASIWILNYFWKRRLFRLRMLTPNHEWYARTIHSLSKCRYLTCRCDIRFRAIVLVSERSRCPRSFATLS